jgi:hypothetical protein
MRRSNRMAFAHGGCREVGVMPLLDRDHLLDVQLLRQEFVAIVATL